jgi:hypothetical protein
MKHLRKYNESINTIEDVELFVRNNLAYLLDDSYKLSFNEKIGHPNFTKYIEISIGHTYTRKIDDNLGDFRYFSWEDIKDDFIPFIEVLKDKYKIGNIIFYTMNIDPYKKNEPLHQQKYTSFLYKTVDDINDSLSIKKELREVLIEIKNN